MRLVVIEQGKRGIDSEGRLGERKRDYKRKQRERAKDREIKRECEREM